jgi:ferredoxin-type protein NapH
MKRQEIRKALILISFFLFPITIFYMSPVLIIEGAAKGIVTGSFILFGLLLVSGLVVGRAFCGWICPGAGLQEACFPVHKRRARTGKADWIKYFLWVPWIAVIASSAIMAGGFHTIDPLFMTRRHYGISVGEPFAYLIYYFFVALIVVLAFTAGKRAFCHYACWMAPFMVIGRKIRNVLKWPSLGLRADPESCRACGSCDTICPMSLEVQNMVKKGDMENSECILCGSCADHCPSQSIRYSFFS